MQRYSLFLFVILVGCFSHLLEANWGTHRHDPARTGLTAAPTISEPNIQLHKVLSSYNPARAPIIVNNNLIFVSLTNDLVFYSLSSNKIVNTFTPGFGSAEATPEACDYTSIINQDDTPIFFHCLYQVDGSNFVQLSALNQSGSLLWETTFNSTDSTPPFAVASTNTTLFMAWNGTLWCISPTNGGVLSQQEIPFNGTNVVAIAATSPDFNAQNVLIGASKDDFSILSMVSVLESEGERETIMVPMWNITFSDEILDIALSGNDPRVLFSSSLHAFLPNGTEDWVASFSPYTVQQAGALAIDNEANCVVTLADPQQGASFATIVDDKGTVVHSTLLIEGNSSAPILTQNIAYILNSVDAYLGPATLRLYAIELDGFVDDNRIWEATIETDELMQFPIMPIINDNGAIIFFAPGRDTNNSVLFVIYNSDGGTWLGLYALLAIAIVFLGTFILLPVVWRISRWNRDRDAAAMSITSGPVQPYGAITVPKEDLIANQQRIQEDAVKNNLLNLEETPDGENTKCCVCFEGEKEALFIPCGHICSCIVCAKILLNRSDKCPICRHAITNIIKAYRT